LCAKVAATIRERTVAADDSLEVMEREEGPLVVVVT